MNEKFEPIRFMTKEEAQLDRIEEKMNEIFELLEGKESSTPYFSDFELSTYTREWNGSRH